MSLQSRLVGCGEGESRRKDSFPGQVVDGTEDSGKVVAPSAGFRADCLFRQVRGRYCCVHYVVVNFLSYEGILGWIQRKI